MSFAADVATATRGDLVVWLEVEGLPYAYGNVEKAASWFTPRADTADEFLGIRAWFTRGTLPSLPDQRLDHIEGIVSGGSLRVSVDDYDGSLTGLTALSRTDDLLRLSADIDYNDVTFNVTGSTSGWAASGTAYVGYETVTYTGKTADTLTGVTRARYRSRAVAHDGGVLTSETADNSLERVSVGTAVTTYPLRLEGRRVWLYVGHSPETIDDCECLWSGVIEEVGFEGDSLRSLVLSCSQAFGELAQGVCADLGTFGADPTEGPACEWYIAGRTVGPGSTPFRDVETYSFRGRPWRSFTASGTPGTKRRTFVADGWHVLRLAGPFSSVPFSTVQVSAATARYDYSNVTEAPTPGGAVDSVIREVLLITDGGAQPFTAGNHPLQVLLQFLMSDLGTGVRGTYDTLPEGFGLAMDPDRVDVAGIEALIEATPGLKVFRVIDQPIENFGEWAREHLLKPFGFYLRPSLGNTIGVGWMTPPSPDMRANAVAIDVGDGGVRRGGLGGWRRDVQDVVSTVRVKAGEQPTPDGFRSITTTTVQVADPAGRLIALDYPKARTVEIDIGGMSGYAGIEENIRRVYDYVAMVGARFSSPVALVDLTVDLRHALRNVGDFVSLTHSRLPTHYSATRGVSGEIWEVVGRRVDLSKCEVVLSLRQSVVAEIETRYLAPALEVTSTASSPTLVVDTATYVANGQNALDAFTVADYVRAYSPTDLSARTTVRRIVGIDAGLGEIELDDGSGISVGDVLIHADYVDWDTGVADPATRTVAFRASSASVLTDDTAANDAPHELA